MKKFKIFLILLLFPLNVLAYSKEIIPGGETLGIEINSDGVMVIGFYQINKKFNKGTPEIKPGDYILKINDKDINNIEQLTNEVEKNINEKYINVTYKRNGRLGESKLDLIKDGNIYKTGLFVKDSITGIGTLSYIDPETKIFGALGHEIIESNTSKLVEIKSGDIFRNYITSIERSSIGVAGSKNAKFYYNTKYGSILKNTKVGIYGTYSVILPNKELKEVALPEDIKLGYAEIYTVVNGEEVESFEINITKINEKNHIKNITFSITDPRLLDEAGGIVQGMSGSPIIQDGKIIGAVTHVIIDNPKTGYGIFITTMLEEGEK